MLSHEQPQLVDDRKRCRACSALRLTNPVVGRGGEYDSDPIGPWSLLARELFLAELPSTAATPLSSPIFGSDLQYNRKRVYCDRYRVLRAL